MRFPRLRFTLPLIAVSLIALTGVTGGGFPTLPTFTAIATTPQTPGQFALTTKNIAAAAGGRFWGYGRGVGNGPLQNSIQLCDDTFATCHNAFLLNRTAASQTLTDISFGNATDNNTVTFLGTGNISANNLTVNTSASGSGFSNFARLNAMPFFSATNNSNIGVDVSNSNNGTAAVTHDNLQNDLANGLQNVLTSSTFSGAFLTSGPTGQMAATFTLGAIPYCIGSNSVARMCWDSSGTITFPTGTSLFNAANLTGSLADARLSANVVKYNDSGTNFTGGTLPTFNGQAVCQANGTNCLAANVVDAIGVARGFYKSANESRNTTVTLANDGALILNAVTLSVSKQYEIRAFLTWDQGGATTNGINIKPVCSGTGASLVQWSADSTINTSAGNAAATSNGQQLNNSLSVTIGSAGLTEYAQVRGVFTSASSGATTCSIQWAQAASVATNTTVEAGSYMTITRLN